MVPQSFVDIDERRADVVHELVMGSLFSDDSPEYPRLPEVLLSHPS